MTTLTSLRHQRTVDRLLAPWQGTTGPGVTIGVVWLARPGLHEDSSATLKPIPTP